MALVLLLLFVEGCSGKKVSKLLEQKLGHGI